MFMTFILHISTFGSTVYFKVGWSAILHFQGEPNLPTFRTFFHRKCLGQKTLSDFFVGKFLDKKLSHRKRNPKNLENVAQQKIGDDDFGRTPPKKWEGKKSSISRDILLP